MILSSVIGSIIDEALFRFLVINTFVRVVDVCRISQQSCWWESGAECDTKMRHKKGSCFIRPVLSVLSTILFLS
jgi:hypothetical protein